MRRWFPAIAASLIFHLLLLLLPASVPEASEAPPVLHLVLRHIETPAGETSINSETAAPAASQPGPQTPQLPKESAPSEVQEKTSAPKPLPPVPQKVQKEPAPVQKSARKKVPPPKKEPAPVKAPPAAPSLSSGTPGVSPPPETPAAGEDQNRTIPTPPSPGRAAEPVDGEKLSIVKRIVPDYPLFSRKRGEEGKTDILVTIESGRVTDAEIERSSGSTRLDAAALRAAKIWVFSGNVTVRARIPFLFQLEK